MSALSRNGRRGVGVRGGQRERSEQSYGDFRGGGGSLISRSRTEVHLPTDVLRETENKPDLPASAVDAWDPATCIALNLVLQHRFRHAASPQILSLCLFLYLPPPTLSLTLIFIIYSYCCSLISFLTHTSPHTHLRPLRHLT